MNVSKFSSGAAALKDASKGASFSRTEYLSISDGDSAIVRFITDEPEWVAVKQHSGVTTRPKPDWNGDKPWPQRMGVVCRNTKCEGLEGQPPLHSVMDDGFDGCFVCGMKSSDGKAFRASGRGWALACYREEVRENGEIVGYRDKTREVEKDGKTVTEKAVIVVNMGWRNFFSTLEGYAAHYGTIVDRDYLIKRQGEGTATQYQIVPLDPIPGYDLRDAEVKARYDIGLDVDEEIESQARHEWHQRWFDPSYTPPKKGEGESAPSGNGQAAPVAAPAAPSQDATDDELAAMAARVTGRYSAPEATQEAPAPAPTEAPAEAPAQPQPEAQAPAEEVAAPAPKGGLRNIS